ncbi:MAG TPA: hypothetical protein VLN56_00635 [Gammaproteobacteria bacterium]|nr:hypothetical protein [Gammaproteobacteria bacterium]
MKVMLNAGVSGLFLMSIFLLTQVAIVNAAEVHRYKVKKETFSIYPTNVELIKRQQHAVLYQLVDRLHRMGPQATVDFARISLTEMAALYEQEARRLQVDGMLIREGAALTRWQRSTIDYADRLYAMAESVSMQTEIEINITETGELLLLINDNPVILGGPAVQDNLVLDRRIIEVYCRQNDCIGTGFSEEALDTRRTIMIKSDWILEEGEPPQLVTEDGLHFVFDNLENRKKKQRICLEISKELKALEETLRDALAEGLYIDWDAFSIKRLYGSYDYRVVINPFGDSVYMQFPALHPIDNWPEKIRDWLHARLRDETYQLHFSSDELVAHGFQ